MRSVGDVPAIGDAVLEYRIGRCVREGGESTFARASLPWSQPSRRKATCAYLKIHAGYTLNNGVKPRGTGSTLRWVTTVTAGFPAPSMPHRRLREVFAERGIALPLNQELNSPTQSRERKFMSRSGKSYR